MLRALFEWMGFNNAVSSGYFAVIGLERFGVNQPRGPVYGNKLGAKRNEVTFLECETLIQYLMIFEGGKGRD